MAHAARKLLAIGFFSILFATSALADDGRYVDLELVLAVDGSGSMDFEEKSIQRDGYINAIQSPEVIEAVQSGPLGRIAVMYFEWSIPDAYYIVAPWMIIKDTRTARTFAASLSENAIGELNGGTSISGALLFAADELGGNFFRGTREIIDISGDGPNNAGTPIRRARDEVVARHIQINGLPLMLRPGVNGYGTFKNLDKYYEECVIGGPGAFIIPVTKMEEFEAALRRKLVLEIASLQRREHTSWTISRRHQVIFVGAEETPVNCLAGEDAIELQGDPRYYRYPGN